MHNEEKEKIPLDAKLLSDAVIELNISRRSVGLYPRDHPIVRESIERAFQYLQKLFELRYSITLGVAGETLVVDEYSLDKDNPVYREFAQSIHAKGIAAITFASGMSREELIGLHEVITSKDSPMGNALAEEMKKKGVNRISISMVDLSNFAFIEGARRRSGRSGAVWEDYIYGLMEGKLFPEDVDILPGVPPEEVAEFINTAMPEEVGGEAYDRVITAYLKKRRGAGINSETLNRFFSFVERLKPELKRQFLSRSYSRISENPGDFETVIKEMTPEGLERVATLLTENAGLMPEELKGLLDRLSTFKQSGGWNFDFRHDRTAVFDDVEIDGSIASLFNAKKSSAQVDEGYKKELGRMLDQMSGTSKKTDRFNEEFEEGLIDKTALEIILELLDAESMKAENYLTMVTKLSELASMFLETGRFEEILDAYNVLNSHVLTGRFRNEASGSIEHFFHSEEFIKKFIESLRFWGRKEREGAIRLSKALRRSVILPLIKALAEETNSSLRKFYLSVLENIGSDVVPYAVGMLADDRWHVIRNMLYLLRSCNGRREADEVRKFIKHNNKLISLEALKTLLYFKTHDSVPYLKTFLHSPDEKLRTGAIRLAGVLKIREAVSELVTLLEKKDFFGTEAYYKADIVKALGEIGDIRAVEPLQRIFTAKALFYKGNLEDLKVEILKNLGNYPPDSIKKLVKLGLESKNEKVRAAGAKVLSKPAEQV